MTAADLRHEALQLADELAAAGRRMRHAFDEKQRLARLLDGVLEQLDAGVILTDERGDVLAANRAATELGLIAGDRASRALAFELSMVAPGVPPVPFHPTRRPELTCLPRANQVPLPNGAFGTLYVVTDITAWEAWQTQAARRLRFEAAGRMAAELAHEVRNPLGSLELFASLLVQDLPPGGEPQLWAREILAGVQRLTAIVSRLLQAVRGQAGRKRRCDLREVATDAVTFVRPLAQARQIRLCESLPNDPLVQTVDPEALHQALLNLLGNALEVTPAAGTIELRVVDAAGAGRLEVHDSGPGIPLAWRERVFEPLFTTRPAGTGLGLAIVERVAIDHGGRAEIATSPLGGAVISLVLPSGSQEGE